MVLYLVAIFGCNTLKTEEQCNVHYARMSVVNGKTVTAYNVSLSAHDCPMIITDIYWYPPKTGGIGKFRLQGVDKYNGRKMSKFYTRKFAMEAADQLGLEIHGFGG